MTNLEALRAIQELFADPARHTRLYPARNASGHEVPTDSPEATCWCFIGGAMKVTGDNHALAKSTLAALKRQSWRRYCRGLVSTSDDLGLDAVRLVIADAIAQELSHAD